MAPKPMFSKLIRPGVSVPGPPPIPTRRPPRPSGGGAGLTDATSNAGPALVDWVCPTMDAHIRLVTRAVRIIIRLRDKRVLPFRRQRFHLAGEYQIGRARLRFRLVLRIVIHPNDTTFRTRQNIAIRCDPNEVSIYRELQAVPVCIDCVTKHMGRLWLISG